MNRTVVLIVVFCFGCVLASGQNAIIATVAGNGTTAQLNQPQGVAVDAAGDIFIADTNNNRIAEVVAGSGKSTTFVGPGGYAALPPLAQPTGLFVDAAGDLFIADTGNNMIREVPVGSNVVLTIAGGGSQGFYGDAGAATAAVLWSPQGVAVDAAGNVYIADTQNDRIRKVATGTGIITTIAGNGSAGFMGDGAAGTAAELYAPTGIAVDGAGNIYIADRGNNRIREVSTSGTIKTVAGNGVAGYSGDNGAATAAALYNPTDVFLDGSGNLFIAVTLSNRIREVSGGVITTVGGDGALGFYGDGGVATQALVSHPSAVAVDSSGDIFIADTGNNRVREVSVSTAPPPSINAGGVVPVFSSSTTIQAGEWVSIYGTNLATTTANWTGNYPTSLGGTSVTIDGIAAYLSYVSPGLVNVQAPDDPTIGPVTVVLKTALGSASTTVNLGEFAPSFSLLDNKHVAGLILRSNGSGAYGGGTYDIIGPTGNSLGYATVAAKAGDVVELYGVGLGPTSPHVAAGEPYSGSAPTTNTVGVSINGKNAIPTFAGLSSSGLDQINLVIPAGLGTGDVPLAAAAGGSSTQNGVVISLQ